MLGTRFRRIAAVGALVAMNSFAFLLSAPPKIEAQQLRAPATTSVVGAGDYWDKLECVACVAAGILMVYGGGAAMAAVAAGEVGPTLAVIAECVRACSAAVE
jgi:hypothetical protein